MFNVIFISPVSLTIEILNDFPYFSEAFDVYLNNQKVKENITTNVVSIYDLEPNTKYEIKINDEIKTIETPNVEKVYIMKDLTSEYKGIVSPIIQRTLDEAPKNSLLVFDSGDYHILPLIIRSNLTIYLKKGARLIAETNRNLFPILNKENFPGEYILPSWEGEIAPNYLSIISILDAKNINFVGEGTIDGNAQNSDWWINHKIMRGAWRPHNIFIDNSEHINFQGVRVMNSPSWTIHPYYSSNLGFYDLEIINPKDSPNTDGLNPESSNMVEIIGVKFNVGDDCIAIKSGKIDMAEINFAPSQNITIRNCFMGDGHGGVVLGSEMSCGIKNLDISKCYFKGTDRGLRIKTRRGRGDKAIVDNVVFQNIYMDEVLNPLVINMFYFCDDDGKTEYVYSKEKLPVDKRTPYLGSFYFKNIECHNTIISSGYFYGLPEMKIKKISLENVTIDFMNTDIYGYPAMMSYIDKVNRFGLYFNNVEKVELKNVKIINQVGEKCYLNNVDKIMEEE